MVIYSQHWFILHLPNSTENHVFLVELNAADYIKLHAV